MAEVFISYRREDSQSDARSIKNDIEKSSKLKVFLDRSGIQPGDSWPDEINEALAEAKVVLVVIGRNWLTSHYEDGRRRIDDEEDWVYKEIKAALQANKLVIPVLIGGSNMPSERSLPEGIKGLSKQQAAGLDQAAWESGIRRLVERILEYLGPDEGGRKPVAILMTSRSPRRRELLQQMGWVENRHFFTINASVNLPLKAGNRQPTLEDVKELVERTAGEKIDFVRMHLIQEDGDTLPVIGESLSLAETIIVGVDTVVFCRNKILDRPLLKALELAGPEDIEQARERAKAMLLEQRGQQIHVITSIAMAVARDYRNKQVCTVVTEGKLRDYTEADIEDYITYAEPFDKAGAFGIQEKGVSLFESIHGSYTNVVGLPLQEFYALLQETFGDQFKLPPLRSTLGPNRKSVQKHPLSMLAIGDINFDYIYDKLPEDFFTDLLPPGKKVKGEIYRDVGGTAVNFAKGARQAGFEQCYVAGVCGNDALSQEIVNQMLKKGITPLLQPDPILTSSIAIILRNVAKEDTSITLTDARQSLPDIVVDQAKETIRLSDVFYCSGYCLIDRNRRKNALKMLKEAHESKSTVVLDIVVGMDLKAYENTLHDDARKKVVDIAVSELPEILKWLDIDWEGKTELEAWEQDREAITKRVRQFFQVAILRTSNYSHEIVVTPETVIGPRELDYGSLSPEEKIGYGDVRTAAQVYDFLSPRIVLASKSPQRIDLLQQIVSSKKIEVQVSTCDEENVSKEDPFERVKRLAAAKAKDIFNLRKYNDRAEFIIGADTEIIRQDEKGQWKMVGHPDNADQAEKDLLNLNGKTHLAITGIAIIGRDPKTKKVVMKTDCVRTSVTFADNEASQIRVYAQSGEPIDRAGAYAIQGLGNFLIKEIDGSYSNVVGLPLERVSEILAVDFARPIWMFDKVSRWNFSDPIKGEDLQE